MTDIYVLDSCALIAFFRQEVGAEIVTRVLESAAEEKCTIFIHKASIAEVYYDTLRFSGREEAKKIFKVLATLQCLVQIFSIILLLSKSAISK